MHTHDRTADAEAAFWSAFHDAEREADAAILGLSDAELDAHDTRAEAEVLLGRARGLLTSPA